MHGKVAPRHPDRLIAALARIQHGVVSAAQLRAAGLTPGQIEGRLRAGRFQAVHRGVYVVGHAALSREGRWMAAVLACGEGAVLSHGAAASHWGVRGWSAASIDVTVPRRSGRSARRGITVHRVRSLPADERTVRDGIPVTTLGRTLVDLSSVLPRAAVERAVEESERLSLFDLRAVEAVLDRHPRRSGTPVLKAVLGGYREEHGLTRSELERLFLDLCEKHDTEFPVVNGVVDTIEVDFFWRAQRLMVECDGRETHGTRAAFERDRARDAWLTARGYRVVRFTWRRVLREPVEVARLLRRLLA